MLIAALTGVRPSAAAWSPNEEKRRKALLSYFIDGVPYILWDNIPKPIDFQQLFLEQEADEDDGASLADALDIMAREWPMEFKAADVAALINDQTNATGRVFC
jgi:hypothetical protein